MMQHTIPIFQSFIFLYFSFVFSLLFYSDTTDFVLIQRVSFACFETVTEWRATETQAAAWNRTGGLLCYFISLALFSLSPQVAGVKHSKGVKI